MSCDPKRVLLAGASGYIGRAVARRLVDSGFAVLAPVRRSTGIDVPGVEKIDVDLTDAQCLRAALDGQRIDAVISCIASRTGAPTDAWQVDYQANVNLLDAARDAGAQHFVLLSAICVQRPRLAFQRAKLKFEAALQQSGIRYSIVRPTAFFKSLSGQIERVRRGKPFLVFGDGTQTACKPLSGDDLAAYLVSCLNDPGKHNQILPIGGPGEAITAREQGQMLFELAGRPPRFRSVSPRLFTLAWALLALPGKLIPALAAKAEFARIGHYYATESMLVWDENKQRYDADATPSTGSQTLREHYAQVWRDGLGDHAAGEHKLF